MTSMVIREPTVPRSGVVAGIDCSSEREDVIRWAAAEAAARRTGLLLVHAFSWPGFPRPLTNGELPPGFRAGADQVVQESVELARKLEPAIAVEGCHLDGLAYRVLLEVSRDAGVLVIGGRRVALATSCSTGARLAAGAHCPVVVVRPWSGTGEQVLIGYDGSPASSLALDFGLDHAKRHHLQVHVIAAQQHVAEVRDREGGGAAVLVPIHGRPVDELLRQAADARLVVIGARGLGGFTDLLLGSFSQTVLKRVTCPVALIPEGMIRA